MTSLLRHEIQLIKVDGLHLSKGIHFGVPQLTFALNIQARPRHTATVLLYIFVLYYCTGLALSLSCDCDCRSTPSTVTVFRWFPMQWKNGLCVKPWHKWSRNQKITFFSNFCHLPPQRLRFVCFWNRFISHRQPPENSDRSSSDGVSRPNSASFSSSRSQKFQVSRLWILQRNGWLKFLQLTIFSCLYLQITNNQNISEKCKKFDKKIKFRSDDDILLKNYWKMHNFEVSVWVSNFKSRSRSFWWSLGVEVLGPVPSTRGGGLVG